MSDFGKFLTRQKPLCLGLPFHKELVSRNIYYTLAERSEADFNGRNLFEQLCANSAICTFECRGRPVPKYPELEPFISRYDPSEGFWGGQPVWFIKIDTCHTCPFKDECTKVCPSMGAFDARHNNREDLHLDFSEPLESLTDDWLEKLYYQDDEEDWVSTLEVSNTDIAWDCLSEPQRAAVVMVLVQGKTFEQAAQLRGVSHQALQKSYNSGMAKLKEFGLARRVLREPDMCEYALKYYVYNLSQPEIAHTCDVSQYTVSIRLKEFREKHGINS